MTVQKTQVVVPKNDIRAGGPCWRLAISLWQTDLVQKLLVQRKVLVSQA